VSQRQNINQLAPHERRPGVNTADFLKEMRKCAIRPSRKNAPAANGADPRIMIVYDW
jgi:hypothetical protein